MRRDWMGNNWSTLQEEEDLLQYEKRRRKRKQQDEILFGLGKRVRGGWEIGGISRSIPRKND